MKVNSSFPRSILVAVDCPVFFSSDLKLNFSNVATNKKNGDWLTIFLNTAHLFQNNMSRLTGPMHCKKTTRHHARLSLCAKLRKTNDAKLRKWPKTSICPIFGRF